MTLKCFLAIVVVIKFSPNNLKRILLNNPAAISAKIEVFLSGRGWCHFVAGFVAGKEAGSIRGIAAKAMPCVTLVFFVGDKFFLNHVIENSADKVPPVDLTREVKTILGSFVLSNLFRHPITGTQ
mgnify:FL=1